MSQLTPQSPLLQPIEYQGQDYFSSQYFHAQYVANSPHGGKYRQHSDFMRVVRTIEAYNIYVNQEHIIEISLERVKSEAKQVLPYLMPAFKAAGYHSLTLLNDVAQVALSHHLDDAISQQMSVAANTFVARGGKRRGLGLPEEDAERVLRAYLSMGQLLGTPLHIVQQEAVKQIAVSTGVNMRPLLQGAPAQDGLTTGEMFLEPTEIGKALGYGDYQGQKVNRLLMSFGWQIKTVAGGWEVTPAGQAHTSGAHAWTSAHGTKSGYNLKWNLVAIRALLPTPEVSDAEPTR